MQPLPPLNPSRQQPPALPPNQYPPLYYYAYPAHPAPRPLSKETENELDAVKDTVPDLAFTRLLPKFEMGGLHPAKFGRFGALKLTQAGQPIADAHF